MCIRDRWKEVCFECPGILDVAYKRCNIPQTKATAITQYGFENYPASEQPAAMEDKDPTDGANPANPVTEGEAVGAGGVSEDENLPVAVVKEEGEVQGGLEPGTAAMVVDKHASLISKSAILISKSTEAAENSEMHSPMEMEIEDAAPADDVATPADDEMVPPSKPEDASPLHKLSLHDAIAIVKGHDGHGDGLAPGFNKHLARLSNPDRVGWRNQGELCWLKQGKLPWWPCQVIPTPAGRASKPEHVWLFNFGTNDYSLARENSQRLVSFRAQYRLMVENNVPKEPRYLDPGPENWYMAVAAALELEKSHVEDAIRRESEEVKVEFVHHQATYKAISSFLRARFEVLREALLHEYMDKNPELDELSDDDDDQADVKGVWEELTPEQSYRRAMLLGISVELGTDARGFFVALRDRSDSETATRVVQMWAKLTGTRMNVHKVAGDIYQNIKHDAIIAAFDLERVPAAWIPQLRAFHRKTTAEHQLQGTAPS
eukprot:TRINITY_DN10553_c0_g1_i3.p1 TRINITY_DN10553_c0_g1~~TRINITY_DN10553_c0_g1_i3.p1  ORF type:complete len:490 (+),score=132.91 TRINITY_DN10553_c0_g1_i3:201-1670(+)